MPAQQWEYDAGVNEEAGRGIEPRNASRRGQPENPHSRTAGKADGLHAPEGRSPGRVLASVRDTTGV